MNGLIGKDQWGRLLACETYGCQNHFVKYFGICKPLINTEIKEEHSRGGIKEKILFLFPIL
jgi:hypothetical protein